VRQQHRQSLEHVEILARRFGQADDDVETAVALEELPGVRPPTPAATTVWRSATVRP
jgi:hypothetical protein